MKINNRTSVDPVSPVGPAEITVGSMASPSSRRPLMRRIARGILRSLFVPLLYIKRHPVRTACSILLIGLIGVGLTVVGIYLFVDYHLSAAQKAFDRGHNIETIEHLRSCRQFRPDKREVLMLCARVARRSNAWNEADEFLARYAQLHGETEELAQERLFNRAARGEIETVGPLLLEYVNRGGALANLAREALISGLLYRYLLPSAEQEINRWLQSDPDSTMALQLRARLHHSRMRYSESLLDYRRILEIDPEHDEIRLKLTTNLITLRQGAEALIHLEYLRKRSPNNPEVLLQLGQVYDLLGRTDDAKAVLDDCIQRFPRHADALAERGRMARRDADGAKAEEYLRRAIELDPVNYAARYQYYLTLTQNGKQAEAAEQQEASRQLEVDSTMINHMIKTRIPISPNDPGLQFELAMMARKVGRPGEELRWLLNTLQSDPNYIPAHRELSSLYYQMGNPVLAARHRAVAQRLGGGNK
jgi:tetratricopeptide (TPR) repeat protein